ncbi:unnamed protein product [Phaedon cochleariae]|uniref:GPI inositol-deacylase n=1 Tax=Phaedon cochleariae TaxID=80249 RepID=A0A9N9SA08_PHACE|nr:unnamed protein product [Phaedon cochleariae]
MKIVGGFILLSLIITCFYFVGLLKFLIDHDENKCGMTYMYEFPQFVRIANKVDKQYRKYGLYAYSEGRLTERARNMYFDGIPVLFIPGNAGSCKQVRSISSVALRKSLDSRINYHFDYFTVDFNEELSGLYGPLLFEQLHYVNKSLHRILELYKDGQNKPRSVIIVGHSIGGIIALNLASQLSNPKLVPLIITLATPVKRPFIILDYHIEQFYNYNVSNLPRSTTIISISGGYRDILIPPHLIDNMSTIHVATTNIPMCWLETNHVEIVWCKQLVMALNRALFDSVDLSTRQISMNSTYRNSVFHHHLIHHSGIRIRSREKYSEMTKLDHRGQWIENIKKHFTVKYMRGVGETHWHMVRLSTLPGYEILTVLALNLETVDWIFACNANLPKGSSRVCSEAIHLTHISEIAPSKKYKRRYFQINMKEVMKNHPEMTHIVFRTVPTNEPVVFHVDIHDESERLITVDLPKWWSPRKHVVIENSAEKAIDYELVLPQLQHITQNYQLSLEVVKCPIKNHHASASLLAPWSNENFHGFITDTDNNPINIRLYSSKPTSANHSSASIKLKLEPACTYRVSLQSTIFGSLGQIARVYTPLLLTNIAVVLLMSLRYQLKTLGKGYCAIIFVALSEGTRPYYVLTLTKFLSQMLNSPNAASILPRPDINYLMNEGTDFFLLPLLLFLCSVGITWILVIVFSISLIAMESTVHKLSLRFLARAANLKISWTDHVMNVLHKVPIVVAFLLVLLSITTCGGLALCLGMVFYFLRLTQMSQDFVEEVVWYTLKKIAKKFKGWFSKKRIASTDHPSIENIKEEITEQEQEQPSNEKNTKDGGNPTTSTNADGENSGEESPEEIDEEQDGSVEKDNEILDNSTDREHTEDVDEVRDEGQTETIDEGTPEEDSELSSAYNAIFFHSTLFFLWCIVTVINIPAVLTWAHNFKYNTSLTPDSSFIPGVILNMCALALWQFEFPKTGRKWSDKLEIIIMALAIASLLFATVSLYRLNYILTFTIVIVTLHQLFAPKCDENNVSLEGNDSSDDRNKYSNIKSKMQ